MNIVFLDGHTLQNADNILARLEAYGSLTVFDRTEPSQIIERSADADVLIVNKTPLPQSIIAQLPNLKLICVAATGYDKVDTNYARQKGIPVCNCANYSTQSVAQIGVSLILEAADHVGAYTEQNMRGEWCKSNDFCYTSLPRTDLNHKKMAIIGYGNIGHTLATIMHALGLEIYAVTSKDNATLPPYVRKISINQAFANCDIVSLNCPLTPQNKMFVNKALLDTAKAGLILLNTARGGLINEKDVANALKSKRLGAYCTDVLTQEPPLPNCPLFTAPNVYITPHIGWKTPQTVERIVNILAQNIENFINNKPLNAVNL